MNEKGSGSEKAGWVVWCDADTAASDPASNATSTQHDVFGNVTGVTDPLGNQTLFTYNADFESQLWFR